jgi:hypothetical protein
MGRAARTLIESGRLSSWQTIAGEATPALQEHPLDLERLATGAGSGASGDGPVALPRSAVDLAIEWDHGRRLSAFEQVRVQIHTAHDGEGQLSQALSDLMRQVCLRGSQDLLPRSLVFVPTRRCADAHLPAAVAAEALAAQVSEPVCLVDADLRAPSLHHRFGIRRAPGVSDLLVHRLMPIPVPLRGNWSLMPAGTRCLEAVRLFATRRGRGQLHRLIRRFAYTVISAPPPVAGSDAALLGSLADGVVLVVNEPSMRTRRLAAVAGQLESAGVRIVGAVLHAPGNEFLDAIDRWF